MYNVKSKIATEFIDEGPHLITGTDFDQGFVNWSTCTHITDERFLEDEDIIDLRAGFYEKFYQIKKPYTTMKFIKDGKVVSHWAKAYRGIILRLLAQNNIQNLDELMSMEIDNLSIEEIKKQKLKTEIIYSIK